VAQHSKLEVTALSDSTATFNRDRILAATSSAIHNIVAGNSISGLTVVNSVYGSNTIIGNGTTMFSMPEECSPKTTTSAPAAAAETAAWEPAGGSRGNGGGLEAETVTKPRPSISVAIADLRFRESFAAVHACTCGGAIGGKLEIYSGAAIASSGILMELVSLLPFTRDSLARSFACSILRSGRAPHPLCWAEAA